MAWNMFPCVLWSFMQLFYQCVWSMGNKETMKQQIYKKETDKQALIKLPLTSVL